MMAAFGWMLLKIFSNKKITRLNKIVVAAAKAAPGAKIIIQTKKHNYGKEKLLQLQIQRQIF